MKQNFTAILFYKPEKGMKPRKYRNITNLQNFANFALKTDAWYMNLYDKRSGKFEGRKYLKIDFT